MRFHFFKVVFMKAIILNTTYANSKLINSKDVYSVNTAIIVGISNQKVAPVNNPRITKALSSKQTANGAMFNHKKAPS